MHKLGFALFAIIFAATSAYSQQPTTGKLGNGYKNATCGMSYDQVEKAESSSRSLLATEYATDFATKAMFGEYDTHREAVYDKIVPGGHVYYRFYLGKFYRADLRIEDYKWETQLGKYKGDSQEYEKIKQQTLAKMVSSYGEGEPKSYKIGSSPYADGFAWTDGNMLVQFLEIQDFDYGKTINAHHISISYTCKSLYDDLVSGSAGVDKAKKDAETKSIVDSVP